MHSSLMSEVPSYFHTFHRSLPLLPFSSTALEEPCSIRVEPRVLRSPALPRNSGVNRDENNSDTSLSTLEKRGY